MQADGLPAEGTDETGLEVVDTDPADGVVHATYDDGDVVVPVVPVLADVAPVYVPLEFGLEAHFVILLLFGKVSGKVWKIIS